jgi:hypothetical protein
MLSRKFKNDLQSVLVDISSLALFLNGNTGHITKLDGYDFLNIVILMGYRLIQITPIAVSQP